MHWSWPYLPQTFQSPSSFLIPPWFRRHHTTCPIRKRLDLRRSSRKCWRPELRGPQHLPSTYTITIIPKEAVIAFQELTSACPAWRGTQIFHSTYEYNRLPFGWKNSGAWFQKMMNGVLLDSFSIHCNVYVDNIIIYSRTQDEHVKHLLQIVQALNQAKLKINLQKSEFFKSRVAFVWHVFEGHTKSAKQQSVQRISQLVEPCDLHCLRVFLSLAGHFRVFLKDYIMKLRCLTALTQKVPFRWSDKWKHEYQELVTIISSDPILILPDFSLPFKLITDASNYSTGAVLYQ